MLTRTTGGLTTSFAYDLHNRLINAAYPGSTPSVSKTYTNTHKLDTLSSGVAARAYNYDANDNLTGE